MPDVQLAEGGHLVLPLEIHGYTRSITLQRQGDVLRARGFTHCGFVRDQDEHARNTPVVDPLDGRLQIRFEDGHPVATERLEEALHRPRHEVATGVTVGSDVRFGSLQLFAATTPPSFCRLAVDRSKDTGITRIAKGADAPAILGKVSLACPTHRQTRHGDNPADRLREFAVRAFGDRRPGAGARLAVGGHGPGLGPRCARR
ncbi:hypothetical protein [Streptomyces atratus]|uniref:hypothetical protein n=1 Tax=Streptomyces atratus TaxID=1893 RepID=UPI00166FEDC7|nr:hypothetical protein [Streptomyces atratus]